MSPYICYGKKMKNNFEEFQKHIAGNDKGGNGYVLYVHLFRQPTVLESVIKYIFLPEFLVIT